MTDYCVMTPSVAKRLTAAEVCFCAVAAQPATFAFLPRVVEYRVPNKVTEEKSDTMRTRTRWILAGFLATTLLLLVGAFLIFLIVLPVIISPNP